MLHVVFIPETTLGRVLLLPNQKGPALKIPERNALNILFQKKYNPDIKSLTLHKTSVCCIRIGSAGGDVDTGALYFTITRVCHTMHRCDSFRSINRCFLSPYKTREE